MKEYSYYLHIMSMPDMPGWYYFCFHDYPFIFGQERSIEEAKKVARRYLEELIEDRRNYRVDLREPFSLEKVKRLAEEECKELEYEIPDDLHFEKITVTVGE